jgi:hypothetical protein
MQYPGTPHTNLIPAGTAVTANGSKTFNTGNYNSFVASYDVTAESGTTPTLAIQFQDSADNGLTWNNLPSTSLISLTSSSTQARLAISGPLGSKLKAVWTIGGTTPSFTMSLDVCGGKS